MSDSFLFDAGWLFFTAWSIIVAVVSLAAFGPDILPSRAGVEPAHGDRTPKPNQSTQSGLG